MDFLQLIPTFGNLAFTIVAFVGALLVIVAIHEYGHYIVGRWSGIHAEVFSIGFGPVLWSRMDKRGTKWQLAAIPLGGYVKFYGDGDAASALPDGAVAEMNEADARRSMFGAPLWARAATVAAGPIFNFILSILIYTALIMARGVASDPLTIAEVPTVPYEQGLIAGDQVTAIEGVATPKLEEFGAFTDDLPDAETLTYNILRSGQALEVRAPHPYPAFVGAVTPDSAASDAELQVGDYILSANGTKTGTFGGLINVVKGAGGTPVALEVWRNGEVLNFNITPRRTDLPKADGSFETRFLIGISGGLWFQPATETPGLWDSVTFAADRTYYIMKTSLTGLYHMVAGDISTCNVSGPIRIAQTSAAMAEQGVLTFLSFIALLSTAVGLINLFPIPVLDGGHLMFFAYEAIARRPPNETVQRLLTLIGLAAVLSLMVFGLTNDLTC